jgi:hypothetical protein
MVAVVAVVLQANRPSVAAEEQVEAMVQSPYLDSIVFYRITGSGTLHSILSDDYFSSV